MNLSNKIISAEGLYKDLLESFFISYYPGDVLVSHGIDHHRRVWNYAKELLTYLEEDGVDISEDLVIKLLIACYMHDTGIIVDKGIRHGHHSRRICSLFLKENNIREADCMDLLYAVENHDDKEYKNKGKGDLLLKILAAADDLDAFGKEGALRYLEIYRARTMQPELIIPAIRENARRRFENFENEFKKYPDLIAIHKTRYHSLLEYLAGIVHIAQ